MLLLVAAAIGFPLSTDAGLVLGKHGPLVARAMGNYLLPALAILLFLGIWGRTAERAERET
jgi:hypothetical protein